ncbi:MAG: hypothetical protein ABIG32_02630 [Candidatus Uhrbacteria bacterium]|nr:hypothetical protein [Patescibacteria group bacterium]MBU1907030.1 hypothetical protein [Patescibacteria group bacterium]
MQNTKWAALGVTTFALALIVSTALIASADEGDASECNCPAEWREHQEQRAEHRAEMKELFAAGDYEAWAEFMADKPNAAEFVTEENFNTLVEAHALLEAGDRKGARELLDAAGIKPPMKGRGPHGSPPTTE